MITTLKIPPSQAFKYYYVDIYEVSYVEQKLKEIKSAFKKDYDRNNQYVKFFKKVNKQVKTEVNDDVKGGAKGRKK